jgi:hypothetical protein
MTRDTWTTLSRWSRIAGHGGDLDAWSTESEILRAMIERVRTSSGRRRLRSRQGRPGRVRWYADIAGPWNDPP